MPRDRVERVAICGNPIQLSLFQGMEIRDLAYAGESKRASFGVEVQSREARIITAGDIDGLDLPGGAELVVPPAVRHEVGADALAMMLKSGMLDRDEIALVTDYGTNAEMALKVGDRVVTGSAACGPAFEGPHAGITYLIPIFATAALVFGTVNGLIAASFMDNAAIPSPSGEGKRDLENLT